MITSFQGRPVEFSDAEAPGAWPNGTRVRKVGTSAGDKHADGALATVRGSLGPPGLFGYFVEWEDLPNIPVFIAGIRLATVDPVDPPPAPTGCRMPGGCNKFSLGCRALEGGRFLHLVPMMHNFRLCLESSGDNEIGTWSRAWCYDRSELFAAVAALFAFDGEGDPPGPWKKSVHDGRRGPGAGPRPDGDEAA